MVGKVKIDWVATVLLNSKADDRVNFVFYNENTDQTLSFTDGVTRSASTSSIEIPTIWNGATIHYWLYFTTANGSGFSTSQYVDQIEL